MAYLLTHTIEKPAESFPDKSAFICGNQKVTYQELVTKSNQVANHLIKLGVQKGDRIGIYLNRSIETAISIYGIMKAGCIYVPLDHENHPHRNAFIINDCGIKVLITNPSQKRGLLKILGEEVRINAIVGNAIEGIDSISWEQLYGEILSEINLPTIKETDLAYILYTSGSTGTPKGIMHSHFSGLSYAQLSVDYYDIHENDILANHAAINFDISTLGYFAGPLAGATTVIISDPYIKMPASLIQLISKERISIWYSVPSALIKLLDQEGLTSYDFSNLRWVLFAGEPFPTPQLREIMLKWSKARFSNIFGPTEVNGCTYLVLDKVPTSDEPISIGMPWDKTNILIVDEEDMEVSQGQEGELLVNTVTMMTGYWNDFEKTEKSFYRNGLNTYYRTGDLVAKRQDGNLTFLGRKDRQVKLRGYRIELDEINTVLWKHPQIKEATVFMSHNVNNEDQITAALVLRNNDESADFKKYCSKYLSHYAVPERFIIVDQLPRNSRGKIDYSGLMEIQVVS